MKGKKMQNDKHTKQKQHVQSEETRRAFLKKAVWSVPGLIAMGQLVKPVDAQADGTQSGQSEPDGRPDWW
jgi:hypothetical protein